MENKNLIATALRMIGKNIILIADCIHKEDEPATAEEKPKKKTRKTAKAKTEEAADVHEAEPVPEEAEKPKVTFKQVRAALAKKEQKEITFVQVRAAAAQKSKDGYTDAVRNLIESYGVEKLSQIKKEDYAEFLKEVEMIGYE